MRMIEDDIPNSATLAQDAFSVGQMVWAPVIIIPLSTKFSLVAKVKPASGPTRKIQLDMRPFVKKSLRWPAIVKSVCHNVQALANNDPGCWNWEDPILINDFGEDLLVLSQVYDSDYDHVKARQIGNVLFEIELLEFPGEPIFMEGRFLKCSDDVKVPDQYDLGLDGLKWEECGVELKHLDGTGEVATVFEKYVKSLNEVLGYQPN
ncbi:hypothetical protein HDU77_001094 [Chytriomyces hyalinus]|nr:hypothetical protein HDU77_001094 [Chytriomyces hyalinus]